MGYNQRGEKMKCDKKCIHYGKKHPCVFCVRDPRNEDHYTTTEMVQNSKNLHTDIICKVIHGNITQGEICFDT